jgi:hypothetical protein
MKYWREEYFARCSRITKGTKESERAREEGKQGDQVPEGSRRKQARTGAEKDSDQPNNHVHRTTRNSNKEREESQGVSIRNNTEVSNINKGICAKEDG